MYPDAMGRRSVIPHHVLELMQQGNRHCWTIDEVHSGLAGHGLASDPSSVFRAVTRLEGEGRIVRVPIDDRRAHYEVAAGHHDHLVCARCGGVEPLACAVVQALADQVRARSGFVVSDHQLVLTGTCQACDHGDDRHPADRGHEHDRHPADRDHKDGRHTADEAAAAGTGSLG